MAKMGKLTAQIDLHLTIGGKRIIMLDIDTGDWVLPVSITSEEGARLAAAVLPGWPAVEIYKTYGKWMSDDPAPCKPGPLTMITTDLYGLIPSDLYSVLFAAQVTTSEFESLRIDFVTDWKYIAHIVGQRTGKDGIYREPWPAG